MIFREKKSNSEKLTHKMKRGEGEAWEGEELNISKIMLYCKNTPFYSGGVKTLVLQIISPPPISKIIHY